MAGRGACDTVTPSRDGVGCHSLYRHTYIQGMDTVSRFCDFHILATCVLLLALSDNALLEWLFPVETAIPAGPFHTTAYKSTKSVLRSL